MRQLMFRGPGEVAWRDADPPKLSDPAGAVLRPLAGAAFGFGAAGGGHGGAVADRLAVPAADHLLYPAPADIDAAALCTLPDNSVDAYRAVGPPLATDPGADVLIVGGAAASIGLYAVAIAAALGAGTVTYADRDAGRCAQAEHLVFSTVIGARPCSDAFRKTST